MNEKIKALYGDELDIPEQYKDLYEEAEGGWRLSRIEGLATSADVERLRISLRRERADHKEARGRAAKYTPLDDFDMPLEEIISAVDRYKVEHKQERQSTAADTSTMERENRRLQNELNTLSEQNKATADKYRKTVISSSLHTAASKAGVDPAALEDVLLRGSFFEVTDDGKVVTSDEGLDADSWLGNIKDSKPHWFTGSSGGGARGNTTEGTKGGTNVFKQTNKSVASALMRTNPGKADQQAKLAGFNTSTEAFLAMPKK